MQRYLCQNANCSASTFMLEYRNKGSEPSIEISIIKMISKASGIRDIALVLGVSTIWQVMISVMKYSLMLFSMNKLKKPNLTRCSEKHTNHRTQKLNTKN